MSEKILLAVNGTLMRGLKLNGNMLAAGATFVREAKTDAYYRCWSIKDDHPAMIRTKEPTAEIDVEIWAVSAQGLADILAKEPAGLCIGKVQLNDGSEVLGVLGEPWVVEGEKTLLLTAAGATTSLVAKTINRKTPSSRRLPWQTHLQ